MYLKQVTVAAILMATVLVLSACSGQSASLAPTTAPVQPTVAQATGPATTTEPSQPAKPTIPSGDLTRTNEGGSVTFAVKPLNLGSGATTLDFDVAMNTHSVDLGFDLKSMSVLKTDTGVEIAPSAYKGGSGHHVEGKLSFSTDKLAGAKTLSLILKNVAGVAERTFTWNLM